MMTAKSFGPASAASVTGKAPVQWVFVELEELFEGVRDAICQIVAESLKESDLSKVERLLIRCGLCGSPLQAARSLASALGAKAATIDSIVDAVRDRIHAMMASDSPQLRSGYAVALEAAREQNRGVVALTTWPEDFAGPLFERLATGLTAQIRSFPLPDEGTFPATDQWRSAAQAVGASPVHSIVIVTTRASFKTALVAGFRCLAVPDRFTQAQDFSGAARVIEYGDPVEKALFLEAF